jgi:integrase
MILLAFRHGLRAAEVCDLRWDQIDFQGAVLHVRRGKAPVMALLARPTEIQQRTFDLLGVKLQV